jgi:hypothetical protein
LIRIAIPFLVDTRTGFDPLSSVYKTAPSPFGYRSVARVGIEPTTSAL